MLRAAVDVFERKGYAAASVREICQRASVTKPVLYYHFGNKEGVLTAILEDSARQFEAAVAAAVAWPGTAADRLEQLTGSLYELYLNHVPVIRVAHSVYFGPPEATPPFDFARFDRSLTAAIERIVEGGLASGEFRQVPVRELTLVVQGVIAACLRRPNPIGHDIVRSVLNMVFEGVRGPRLGPVSLVER